MNFITLYLNPAIWGTVSDWVGVILTFATGLLIWFTFKSQLTVQKLQQEATGLQRKATEIELFNHKMNIRPEFILEANYFEPELTAEPGASPINDHIGFPGLVFTFKINDTVAKDLVIGVEGNERDRQTYSLNFDEYRSSFVNRLEAIKLPAKLKIIVPCGIINIFPQYEFELLFSLRYKDLDGNPYVQNHQVILKKHRAIINSHAPIAE